MIVKQLIRISRRWALAAVCLAITAHPSVGHFGTARASLLLSYSFNSVSGTAPTQTTPDSSGNNLTGSLLGGSGVTPGTDYPTLVANSPDGSNSMQFFGGTASSKYTRVEVADASSGPLDAAFTNFTVSAWVLTSGQPSIDTFLMGKTGASNNRGWQIFRSANTNTLGFDYFNGSSNTPTQELFVPNVFADNQWIGFAIVFTGNTSIDVYGSQGGVTTNLLHQTTGTLANWNGSNSAPFQVGDRGAFASAAWTGYIDNVNIYNESLTSAQVAALMPAPEPSTFVLCTIAVGLALLIKRRIGSSLLS